MWTQVARCLHAVFHHIDTNPSPSYQFLLQVDSEMQGIMDAVPAWLHDDGPTTGMPCPEWIRNTFKISVNHKVLTLHRPFLHRAFHDDRYLSSRQRAITASRNILREAPKVGSNRLWTAYYHISAAASVVCLDLFQSIGATGARARELEQERQEVIGAVQALEQRQHSSSIARRGAVLVANLLAEEARLRQQHASQRARQTVPDEMVSPDVGGRRKRTASDASADGFAQIAKKVARQNGSPVSATTPSDTALRATLSAAGASGFTPLPSPVNPPTSVALPQEYLSVFLDSGFDPLDGAMFLDTATLPPPSAESWQDFTSSYPSTDLRYPSMGF